MKVKLVDALPLHPLLTDPATGQPLRAIGLSTNGLPMWPLLGADGEEEGESDDDESEEEDGSEDEDPDDKPEDKPKQKSRKTGPVSREEFDALTNRLSAADKRRAAAEKEAAALRKEKEDKDREGKPELDNVKKDLAAITKEHESLQGRFKKVALTNAFLTASQQAGITWHNPRVAQNAGEFDDLEIDEENGSVEGILEAVKALAKKHKYLVNAGKADDEDDEDDGKNNVRRPASGSGVGSTKTGKGRKPNGQLSDEDLRKRFPALKRA